MNDLFTRAVIDKNMDEQAWLAARRLGVTATEVRDLAKGKSVAALVAEKRSGERTFFGNQYTNWGLEREPVIVEEILAADGFIGSDVLYHAPENRRHLATPDAFYLRDGMVSIAEIKTSKHNIAPGSDAFKTANYYDQIQFQMYVVGDDCVDCLYVWEQHEDFVPLPAQSAWIERDQARIDELIVLADAFLAELDSDAPGDDPDDYEEFVTQYLLAKAACDKWAGVASEYADKIRDRIGDRESFSLVTKLGKISLSTPKPTERFDTTAFKELQPGVYKEFLRYTQSKPSLRITAAKGEASDVL